LLAFLGNQSGLIILVDQIVQIVARLENDIAAAAAIAAARAALWPVCFAMKGHSAFASVSRSRVNFDLVDEHVRPGSGRIRRIQFLEQTTHFRRPQSIVYDSVRKEKRRDRPASPSNTSCED